MGPGLERKKRNKFPYAKHNRTAGSRILRAEKEVASPGSI